METIVTKFMIQNEKRKKTRFIEKITYFIFALFLVALMNMANANAASGDIQCHTLNGEKSFKITPRQISFQTESIKWTSFGPQRAISSSSSKVRTKKLGKGIRKYTQFEGNSVIVHIQDLN